MPQPTHYLAIDPGDTTGWAKFNDLGDVTEIGQVFEDEFNEWFRKTLQECRETLVAVIVEDYKNHGHMNQPKWSRNKTSKKIGGIEAVCEMFNIPIHLQSNTVKAIGYAWGGIEKPTNHKISHQYDAYAHGVYWLQQNGIREAGRVLRQRADYNGGM